MRSAVACGFSLVVLACLPASAQEWAGKMFSTQRHDFGTIAKGAKAVYQFSLENLYVEDVHIAAVRSSCGCTRVSIDEAQRWLKTHQKGEILASINSAAFLGQRGATITVTFDKPFWAEVQLQVSVFIRGDVMLEPGSVQFGPVDQGTAAERQVAISCLPGSGLTIVDVQNTSPHFSAKLLPAGPGPGQTSYSLTVRFDGDAPAGLFHDHVLLVTNDRRQIPVLVEGSVLSAISVTPNWLSMGVVEPGQKVTKNVVVKTKEPSRILRLTCADGDFSFDLSAEREPKRLHIIPVSFVAGSSPGAVTRAIRIETDREGLWDTLNAQATVTAPKTVLAQAN